MARHEADREDLLAEATALVVRGEWQVESAVEPVTAGVRVSGAASIYFGGDPCYHFDPVGRLRRAFVDGALYRSAGTTLSRLDRLRTDTTSVLQREDLDSEAVGTLLARMQREVQAFLEAVTTGRARLTRSVPEDDPLPERSAALNEVLQRLRTAAAAMRLAPALVQRR